MKLLGYELRKLIMSKTIIIYGIFLVIACIIYPIIDTVQDKFEQKNANVTINELQEIFYEYEDNLKSGTINPKNIFDIKENNSVLRNMLVARMSEYLDTCSYRRTGKGSVNVDSIHAEKDNEYLSLDSINNRIDSLKRSNREKSDEYYQLVEIKNKIQNVNGTHMDYVHFWNKYDYFENNVALIYALILVFIIARVQSQERTCNMNMFIASLCKARRKSSYSKLLAGYTVGITGFLLINICLSSVYLGLGSMKGANSNLVNLSLSYAYTPYNYTILQFCLIKLLYQCVAIILLISIIYAISIIINNGLYVALFGCLILVSGLLLQYVVGINIITRYSVFNGLVPQQIFSQYYSIFLSNKYITYPVLYAIFSSISCILLAVFYVFYTEIRLSLRGKEDRHHEISTI